MIYLYKSWYRPSFKNEQNQLGVWKWIFALLLYYFSDKFFYKSTTFVYSQFTIYKFFRNNLSANLQEFKKKSLSYDSKFLVKSIIYVYLPLCGPSCKLVLLEFQLSWNFKIEQISHSHFFMKNLANSITKSPLNFKHFI